MILSPGRLISVLHTYDDINYRQERLGLLNWTIHKEMSKFSKWLSAAVMGLIR